MSYFDDKSLVYEYLRGFKCPVCNNKKEDQLSLEFISNIQYQKTKTRNGKIYRPDFSLTCLNCKNQFDIEIKNEIKKIKEMKEVILIGEKDISIDDTASAKVQDIKKDIDSITIFLNELYLKINNYFVTRNYISEYKQDKLLDEISNSLTYKKQILQLEKSKRNLEKLFEENKLKSKTINEIKEHKKKYNKELSKNDNLNKLYEERLNRSYNPYFKYLGIGFIASILFYFYLNFFTLENINNLNQETILYYPYIVLSLSTLLLLRIIYSFINKKYSLTLFSREYFLFLFRGWKIITFLISLIFISFFGSFILKAEVYLLSGSPGYFFIFIISILTFFTAPWAVGNLFGYFLNLKSNMVPGERIFPYISLLTLFFVPAWMYDLYYLLVHGYYPSTFIFNIFRSIPIYILAGLFWNLEYINSQDKVDFAFLKFKAFSFIDGKWHDDWFQKQNNGKNINNLSIFIKSLKFSLPLSAMFFFYVIGSVDIQKTLSYLVVDISYKDNDIKYNINKSKEVNLPDNNHNEKDIFLNLGNYHALVIGIDDYNIDLGKLDTPINDAKYISNLLLNKYKFEVTTLINPTRIEIIEAIENYRNNLEFNDNLLIYYAGHGDLDKEGDEGYWLPTDASKNSQANWIPNSWIKTQLKAMKAKHVLIIADSCFSAAVFKGNQNTSNNNNNNKKAFINKVSTKITRKALTSGGLEPVLDGGAGKHSIFADAFIKILENNNSTLLGTELYTEISEHLTFNIEQTPTYGVIDKTGHVMGGDFVFVPSNN